MTIRPWWLWGLGIIGVAVVGLLAVIAFALLSDDEGTSGQVARMGETVTPGPSPTATATPRVTPSPTPPAATPEPSPTPCPDCPEPTTCPACPTYPTCPEPVVCPPPTACPQDTPCPACPAPTPCPQCPDPSDLAQKYLLSDACTGAKLKIELGEVAGIDVGASEQFFSKSCQGVSLLGGSVLAEACAAAGLVSGGGFGQSQAVQAAMLVERYCIP